MKKILNIFLFILIIASPSFASNIGYYGHDNSAVKTTVKSTTGDIIYRADGHKIYRESPEGKSLFADLSTMRAERTNKGVFEKYDKQMAESYFITDLSHSYKDNKLVIYAVGITFKPRHVNFNDTNEYKNMKVNVGTLYTALISITDGRMEMPFCEPAPEGLWAAPYSSQMDESRVKLKDNSLYEDEMLLDFVSMVVNPKILTSKYKDRVMYILLHEENSRFDILEFNLDTCKVAKSMYIYNNLFDNISKEYNLKHSKNNKMYFFTETARDEINVFSIGDDSSNDSIGVKIDMSAPTILDVYWKERTKVMADVK